MEGGAWAGSETGVPGAGGGGGELAIWEVTCNNL